MIQIKPFTVAWPYSFWENSVTWTRGRKDHQIKICDLQTSGEVSSKHTTFRQYGNHGDVWCVSLFCFVRWSGNNKKFSRRSPQRLAHTLVGFVLSGAELRHAVLPVVLRVLEEQRSAAPLIVEPRECGLLSTHIFNERRHVYVLPCSTVLTAKQRLIRPHRDGHVRRRGISKSSRSASQRCLFLHGGNSLLTLLFFSSFSLSEIIVLKSTQYVF